MAGLCEGGNEPSGSLKAICNVKTTDQGNPRGEMYTRSTAISRASQKSTAESRSAGRCLALDGVPPGPVEGLAGRPHAVAGSPDRLPADNSHAGGKLPIGHNTTVFTLFKGGGPAKGGGKG
ncbi:hypothetical protein ANN_25808 [Periplaneta americana]|uniref:Uncharacterized protein n=1 Tax=Periplaneta americana TaxID=6978 RepID=A0ABQ8S4I8_PERAM|nr:hypothetical protein ANN_25808 [Periplaneta americana]